jgi:hypothetical protein
MRTVRCLAIGTLAAAVVGMMGLGLQEEHRPRPRAGEVGGTGAPRFEAFDIYVDSGAAPLAAYQVELKATGDVKAVGIEGGAAAAFSGAPYYDPAALHDGQVRERIVIAAFNIGDDVPTGRTRVARVHVQVSGAEPEWSLKVQSAGTKDGSRIEAKAEIAKATE